MHFYSIDGFCEAFNDDLIVSDDRYICCFNTGINEIAFAYFDADIIAEITASKITEHLQGKYFEGYTEFINRFIEIALNIEAP